MKVLFIREDEQDLLEEALMYLQIHKTRHQAREFRDKYRETRGPADKRRMEHYAKKVNRLSNLHNKVTGVPRLYVRDGSRLKRKYAL